MFWPIYLKLENEFKELSYYITIDRKQLKTYSIHIADLILRAVAECENIASELCKRENIKFRDKKGHIRNSVYFNEYIDALDSIFNLAEKHVAITYDNVASDCFDCKINPFLKDTIKENGKEKKILVWYHAYNKIKHDRVKHFRKANIENLILSLSALFMLNVYFMDQVFYDVDNYNKDDIIKKIESFSDVFQVDYSLNVDKELFSNFSRDSFFDPLSYFEIGLPMAVYVIEEDKKIKTKSDAGADLMDKLESKVMIRQADGTYKYKYENYKLTDHKTMCKVVASINRLK